MEITQVHYQRLVSLGNYENERVGAWGKVEEGETADEALGKVRDWVNGQAGQEVEAAEVAEKLRDLRYQYQQLEGDMERLKERWTKAKAWAAGVGLDIPSRFVDTIPF